MDPSLKKYMNSLKRQANKSKIATIAGIVPRPTEREVVPVEAVPAPAQGKKRGRPAKVPRTEAPSSSGSPISLLVSSVRVAPTMQFDLRPEDEEIFANIPTLDMVEETVELQCRAAVATRALGDELRRVKTVSIPKLKSQLSESAVSLKDALKAVDEARTDAQLARKEQEALKITLDEVAAGRADAIKEQERLAAEKELLIAQIEQLQGFMLSINEQSFRQGVRQVAFFHGVPDDDERYDSNMDVVDGRLMPLGDEEAEENEQTADPMAEAPQGDGIRPEESTNPDAIDIV